MFLYPYVLHSGLNEKSAVETWNRDHMGKQEAVQDLPLRSRCVSVNEPPWSTLASVIWRRLRHTGGDFEFQSLLKIKDALLTDLDFLKWQNIIIGMNNYHLVLLPIAKSCGKGRDKERRREIGWKTWRMSFHTFCHPKFNSSFLLSPHVPC